MFARQPVFIVARGLLLPGATQLFCGCGTVTARSRSLQLHELKASTDQEFDIAFASVIVLSRVETCGLFLRLASGRSTRPSSGASV
jgi:hypothetical protein